MIHNYIIHNCHNDPYVAEAVLADAKYMYKDAPDPGANGVMRKTKRGNLKTRKMIFKWRTRDSIMEKLNNDRQLGPVQIAIMDTRLLKGPRPVGKCTTWVNLFVMYYWESIF